LVCRCAGKTNFARFGQRLDAGDYIDASALDIISVNDDIPDIYADPKQKRAVATALAELTNLFLYIDGAGKGVHGARELYERTVAHQFNHSARVTGDRGIDDVTAQRLQPV